MSPICYAASPPALARFARCDPGGLACRPLKSTPVLLPPGLVAWCQIVVAIAQARGAVDELADDVGLPGVPVGLGDHVNQDLVQRHRAPLIGPPRDMTHGVQRQRADRG